MSAEYNEDELKAILDEDISEDEDSIPDFDQDNILESEIFKMDSTPKRPNLKQNSSILAYSTDYSLARLPEATKLTDKRTSANTKPEVLHIC